MTEHTTFHYGHSGLRDAHKVLLPTLQSIISERVPKCGRLFDCGCGNGSAAAHLARQGYQVTGVDPSEEGIAFANREHPECDLHCGSAYDDLRVYGRFPLVYSLEVVEHLYYPRRLAKAIYDLLEPGGTAVLSTPYHGYLKNLVVCLANGFDHHVNPLFDGGHIKFFSMNTLAELLREVGFSEIQFRRVGRIPPLAKSMFAIARKN